MKKASIYVALLALVSMAIFSCQDSSVLSDPTRDNARSGFSAQLAALGNRVWNDENMDGIQDEGEGGIAGVTVNLYDCQENLIESATTGEEGNYLFDGLDAGNYKLEFEAPDGYQFSPQNVGDNDEVDSDPDPETGMTECFELGPDTETLAWDAGMFMVESEGCTYGKGFWKNHCGFGPQDDLVTDLLPIMLGGEDGDYSMNIETAEMAYNILGQHTYGDPSNGITKLYAHLFTAKLNIANGASDEDIAELITDVDTFLADNGYEMWDDLSHEDRQMVNEWKGTFEDYNEGEIGPGSCDDLMIY